MNDNALQTEEDIRKRKERFDILFVKARQRWKEVAEE
jgi:hypothetical protein